MPLGALGLIAVIAAGLVVWQMLGGEPADPAARIDGTWRATHVVVATDLVGRGFNEVGDAVSATWVISHECAQGPCDVSVDRVQNDGRVIKQTMQFVDNGYVYAVPERLGPSDAVCIQGGQVFPSQMINETMSGRLEVTKSEVRDGVVVATELRGWRRLTGVHIGPAAAAGCHDWTIEDEGVLVRTD